METAGVGIRAVATMIDGIILAIISGVIFVVAGGGHYLWSLVIGFGYYSYFESMSGATPGKVLCGLKVVKTDGSLCDNEAAVIRTVCRLIDGLFAYLIGAIFIWSSEKQQRLGDRMADTLVVRVR